MDFHMRFRIVTLTAAVILSWFALVMMLGEALTPRSAGPASWATDVASADWLAAAVPLRGDLLADVAWARAMPLLRPGLPPATPEISAQRGTALALVRESLSRAPHASRTWLLLAMLRNLQPTDGSVAEALKMSYLTAPADTGLIPDRLSLVARSNALDDAEIPNLARNDVRLALTRRFDLKDAIIHAYENGSTKGRVFIKETARALDPGFAATLR